MIYCSVTNWYLKKNPQIFSLILDRAVLICTPFFFLYYLKVSHKTWKFFPFLQALEMLLSRVDYRNTYNTNSSQSGLCNDDHMELSELWGFFVHPGAQHWKLSFLQALQPQGKQVYLRSSPTLKISHSILVSSILLRPKGHSCLSSRLLFSSTICKGKRKSGRELSV